MKLINTLNITKKTFSTLKKQPVKKRKKTFQISQIFYCYIKYALKSAFKEN